MIKNIKFSLPSSGRIKIGRKGDVVTSSGGKDFRPGETINHFLITGLERGDDENFIVKEKLMDKIKKNGGDTNKDGNLVGIPIQLMFNDPDLNFPNSLKRYAGRQLVCEGDNESAYNCISKEKKKCPCEKLYDGKNDQCKYTGVLSVMIEGDEYHGNPVSGCCHEFRTGGKTSVEKIITSLMAIKARTGGQLAFLPLRMIIEPFETKYGSMKYAVSVVPRGTSEEFLQIAMKIAQEKADFIRYINATESKQKLLYSGHGSGSDDSDFVDEFWPDQEKEVIDIKKEKKPAKQKKEPAKEKSTTKSPPKQEPEAEPKNPTPVPAKSKASSEPFGGRKKEVVDRYLELLNHDRGRWLQQFEQVQIIPKIQEVNDILKSENYLNPDVWKVLAKKYKGDEVDTFFVEITIKNMQNGAGLVLWHQLLAKAGVKKANELDSSNVGEFLRKLEIPF